MKVKVNLFAKYEGKIGFLLNEAFLLLNVLKTQVAEKKLVRKRSFLMVPIAEIRPTREPIRIFLFI